MKPIQPRGAFILLALALVVVGLGCSLAIPLTLLRSVSQLAPAAPTVTPLPTPITSPTPAPQPAVNQVLREETAEDGSYTITLYHPELVNAGASGDAFNEVVQQMLIAELDSFKAQAAARQEAGETETSTLLMDFNLYRVDPLFVSILVMEDIHLAGDDGSTLRHSVLNYNIPQSRFLELADLFLPDSNFIFVLAEFSYRELDARLDTPFGMDGLQPIPDNYARWNITPNGLLLTFEQSQAPLNEDGTARQVLIPYNILEYFIDPAGPLGNYLPVEELIF